MRRITLFSLLVSLSLACSLGSALAQPTEMIGGEISAPAPTPASESEKRCGDGVCDGPENAENCPEDCGAENGDLPPGANSAQNEYRVTNPTTGNELYVHLIAPEGTGPFPALVVVPGGIGNSARFRTPGALGDALAAAGIAMISFDPDGRGQSAGEEDYNGHAQQDGLAAVIEFAASLPEVDADQIGLASFSYGITMASGALARYPALPIQFLMDWEGPADRFDTTVDCGNSTQIDFQPCDNLEFWSEREALRFISDVQVPYQRLQSENDHVQPDVDHAINMIYAAVQGGVPWVRLNNLDPNQTYNNDNPPVMLSEGETKSLEQLTLKYVQEMLALP